MFPYFLIMRYSYKIINATPRLQPRYMFLRIKSYSRDGGRSENLGRRAVIEGHFMDWPLFCPPPGSGGPVQSTK